jgi:hypothetical protein
MGGFLLGVLVTVAVFGVGFALLSLTSRRTARETRVETVVPSPDRKLEAVLYVDRGGDADGWCYHRVALREPRDSSPGLEKFRPPSNFLFEVSCGSNVRAEWLSPSQLHIRYSVGHYGVTVYQSASGNSGKVNVTYEIAE